MKHLTSFLAAAAITQAPMPAIARPNMERGLYRQVDACESRLHNVQVIQARVIHEIIALLPKPSRLPEEIPSAILMLPSYEQVSGCFYRGKVKKGKKSLSGYNPAAVSQCLADQIPQDVDTSHYLQFKRDPLSDTDWTPEIRQCTNDIPKVQSKIAQLRQFIDRLKRSHLDNKSKK